jgi:glycosyltransferase involved in cell wall biosynthesis
MRIALDTTAAIRPDRTGIGWYVTHLARSLERVVGPEDALYFCSPLRLWRRRGYRPQLAAGRAHQRWSLDPFPPRGRYDVWHGPDFRLPYVMPRPMVATVHDVGSLASDAWSEERFREKSLRRYRDVARRAAHVIFDSEATRLEYVEHFPEVVDRSSVVHLGVDPAFSPPELQAAARVRERYGLPERFVLYVGEISARKNLPGMARGMVASGIEMPWVWVGPTSYKSSEIVPEVEAMAGVDVIRLGYVPFSDLPALYGAARCLCFATFLEGFGLPALEAMACGTPVVVSNSGALPEVTGGYGLEVDPHDSEEIGAAIRRLWDDDALYADLREQGLKHVEAFTWDRTARAHLAVYRKAIEQAGPGLLGAITRR